MDLKDFYYDLPKELIAQDPLPDRSGSRLCVLDKSTGGITHRIFSEITDYLMPEDCLVINNTKVIPCNPAFAGLLGDAGAEGYNVGSGAVGVIPGINLHVGAGKGQSVIEIHGLAFGPLAINVDEYQLIANILVQHGIGVAHSYKAGAYQRNLPIVGFHSCKPPE